MEQPIKCIVGFLALILTGSFLILLNDLFDISILFNSVYTTGWIFIWVWGLSEDGGKENGFL